MEKTKRNRLLLWIAIFMLTINLAMISTLWVKGRHHFKNKDRSEHYSNANQGDFENKLAIKLDLNPIQIEKFHELKKVHWEKIQPIRDSIKQYKSLIHKELMSVKSDTNNINLIADTIGLLNAEFEKLNYNHLYLLKEQLTDEQLVNFKKIINHLPYSQDKHRERQKKE